MMDARQQSGDMQGEGGPDGPDDETFPTFQTFTGLENVAQGINQRSDQNKGEQKRYRQVEQVTLGLPDADDFPCDDRTQQHQQRKADPPQSRASGFPSVILLV